MVVDLENENSAYLCGRMFAVLEKLQKDSVTSGKLNRQSGMVFCHGIYQTGVGFS